jgi:rhamnose transport system permease protein
MSRFQREFSVATAYSLLLLVLWLAAPSFYAGDKLRSILVSSAPVLVAAVGMTLVILTRQIDISIGSQFSVCGIVAGLLARSGLPMPVVAALTILTGGLLGAINGGLIAGLGLPSIVVTLATMVILREGLRWWREGEFVKNLPPDFQWFGLPQSAGQWLVVAIAGVVLVLFAWSLRNLAGGRAVYATGSDPEAAFLAGMRPSRVVFGVFTALGALTALAAFLNAVRFVDVDPIAGNGLEMQVIAAVVVGGVAISGGRGTLVGPLGAIILAAVAIDAVHLRRGRHVAAH